MRQLFYAAALGAVLLCGPAAAMPQTGAPAASAEFDAGEAAAKAGRYQDAIALLTTVVQQEPENADAFSYLGFSYRKLGDFAKARQHYETALKLDPSHLEALEYYGEMWLQLKDLPKAEEQFQKLVKLCPRGCEPRSELAEAIKKFKAGS